jgi:hypothetical protein
MELLLASYTSSNDEADKALAAPAPASTARPAWCMLPPPRPPSAVTYSPYSHNEGPKEATGGGGGEREPNKIISQEPDLCPMFKTPIKN